MISVITVITKYQAGFCTFAGVFHERGAVINIFIFHIHIPKEAFKRVVCGLHSTRL